MFNKKTLKILLILIFAIILLGGVYVAAKKAYFAYQYDVTHSDIVEISLDEIETPKSAPVVEEEIEEPAISAYSGSINLDIQFYSQAPYADWSLPYQEACEEASLILAYNFVSGISMTKEEFHTELLALIDWETSYFGSYEHTTIAQTAEILTGYYGFDDWEILTDPTVDDLKVEIAKGNPIVAPFAGRLLGNPNYTGLGPLYHMMVLKGFDDSNIITNDVGTRNGHNYQYSHEVLMDALHDWDDIDISFGEKNVLVLTAGD
ncbi:MAG: hypothetical protein UV80_C0007G0035 [Candidatus Peregrinibacteria bacterium GW2011_GWF2_43_17]|nr:MAG: hypothetical protein UV80_C0007G0035 [Candidatus Peregrinibacteria bacterium GW2011_GWF2_43_17]